MKMRLGFLATAFAAILMAASAYAQSASQAIVVTVCGSASYGTSIGVVRPQTQDTTGTLCTVSSGGGGSTSNITGINGVAPSVGNGTTDTGTLRITLSSDGTGQVKLAAGAAVIGHVIVDTTSTTAVTQATAANLNATVTGAGSAGTANAGVVTVQGIASMTPILVTPSALPANQSVNVAQVNGITTLTGSGAVGTGSARIAVGTDTATIAGAAPGTAGSASPNVVTVQGVSSMTPVQVSQATAANLKGQVQIISGMTNAATSALAANLVVHSGAAVMADFEVAADITLSGAAWWLMFYDATSAPADGAVTPYKCYALASGQTTFAGAFPTPLPFTTGITMGVSTTGCFTKTASTHAFLSADWQ